MQVNQHLALLKQEHERFRNLTSGIEPDSLSALSVDQQKVLKAIVGNLYKGIWNIKRMKSDSVFEEGKVMFKADPALIRYYRENITADEDKIAVIFGQTNPDEFWLFELLDGPGRLEDKHVFRTFIAGLEKMSELCEEYPEYQDEYLVDHAWDVINSPLIDFTPDKWIENSRLLQPIMTMTDKRLPVHVKSRLKELYRSYVFDNFLAVISLARATLEYAILDNCNKFSIEPKQKVTYPKEKLRYKCCVELHQRIPLCGPLNSTN